MAHWALIDENNIVVEVLVGNNDDPDEGYQWLVDNLGGRWIKTSHNSYGGKRYKDGEEVGDNHLRFNFAGSGYTYDEEFDAFYPPKPQEDGRDYILDKTTFLWVEI